MRGVTAIVVAVLGSVGVGCMPPAKLTLTTAPPTAGEASIAPTGRIAGVAIDHCPLPCVFEIPRNATSKVTVRAPGYFPATVDISYAAVQFYLISYPQGSFVIPLVPRKGHATE